MKSFLEQIPSIGSPAVTFLGLVNIDTLAGVAVAIIGASGTWYVSKSISKKNNAEARLTTAKAYTVELENEKLKRELDDATDNGNKED